MQLLVRHHVTLSDFHPQQVCQVGPRWSSGQTCRWGSGGSTGAKLDSPSPVWSGAKVRSSGPCENHVARHAGESVAGTRHGNPLDPPSIVVTVLPAEGHMRVIHAENPRIADRRPKDVPR